METQQEKDLWKIAKKRVQFKRHLGTYLIINAMFWLLWWFTDRRHNGFPWPVWPMLGWGIGLAFSYLNAYIYTGQDAVQKEYDRLKGKT